MKDNNLMQVPENLEDLFVENHYAYIYSKAQLYLRLGPGRYRKADYRGYPPVEWEEEYGKELYDVLESGCRQVLAFKGLTPETAFEGLGICGFNRLIWLFHFGLEMQSANPLPGGGFIDRMNLKHTMNDMKMILYNKVVY
jgi:hypothetical protein